jgi:hypothetical protein
MRAVSVFAGGDTSFWVSNTDGRPGTGGGRGIGVASARIGVVLSMRGTDCVTRTETGGVVPELERAASSCL